MKHAYPFALNGSPITARLFLSLLTSIFLLFSAYPAQADNQLEDERYIVYYNVFNSSAVTPEVAKQHGLTRSGYRGFINIAVQRKQSSGEGHGIPAFMTGYVKHLAGTEIPLEFTMIKEGDSIYYIGEFLIANGEPLTFDIDIKPGAEHSGFHLKFSKILYTDK